MSGASPLPAESTVGLSALREFATEKAVPEESARSAVGAPLFIHASMPFSVPKKAVLKNMRLGEYSSSTPARPAGVLIF